MKDTTKRTVKNLFASLVKNDSAIDGAKTAPWWIAVILFIIGTFLPIIPIMVNVSKTYGASYIAKYNYGYDQALVSCGIKLKAEEYSFKLEDSSLIARKGEEPLTNTWVEEEDGVSKDEKPLAIYETEREGVTQIALAVYYSDRPYSSTSKSITALKKVIEAKKYLVGGETLYDVDRDGKKASTYIPSYILLYKGGMFSRIYKTDTATSASATYTGLEKFQV